jgi:excisionase family DNA binding protein
VPTLLTIEEAALRLRVHPGTVYRFAADKKIRVVRVGSRCIRIAEDELDAFLKRGEESAARQTA